MSARAGGCGGLLIHTQGQLARNIHVGDHAPRQSLDGERLEVRAEGGFVRARGQVLAQNLELLIVPLGLVPQQPVEQAADAILADFNRIGRAGRRRRGARGIRLSLGFLRLGLLSLAGQRPCSASSPSIASARACFSA